jgi:hypothetical protein
MAGAIGGFRPAGQRERRPGENSGTKKISTTVIPFAREFRL